MIIAPHPDDESLGCGGLIAEACAQGLPIRLIFISDGAGSHPNSRLYPPQRLREQREGEALQATAALGLHPEDVRFLRFPDRRIQAIGEEGDVAVAAIVDAVVAIDASCLFVTSDLDPHCDHRACYRIAQRVCARSPALRLCAYPIWAWRDPPPADIDQAPAGFRLAVSHHLDKKRTAIFQHQSQVSDLVNDDPSGFRLSADMIEASLQPYEIYLEEANASCAPRNL